MTKKDWINPQSVAVGDKIEFEFIVRFDFGEPIVNGIRINGIDSCNKIETSNYSLLLLFLSK